MSLQSQMLLFDQDPQLWIYKILVFRIKIISCEGHFNRETKIFLSASYQIKSAFINSGFLWNFIYYVGRIIWWQTLKEYLYITVSYRSIHINGYMSVITTFIFSFVTYQMFFPPTVVFTVLWKQPAFLLRGCLCNQ